MLVLIYRLYKKKKKLNINKIIIEILNLAYKNKKTIN